MLWPLCIKLSGGANRKSSFLLLIAPKSASLPNWLPDHINLPTFVRFLDCDSHPQLWHKRSGVVSTNYLLCRQYHVRRQYCQQTTPPWPRFGLCFSTWPSLTKTLQAPIRAFNQGLEAGARHAWTGWPAAKYSVFEAIADQKYRQIRAPSLLHWMEQEHRPREEARTGAWLGRTSFWCIRIIDLLYQTYSPDV